MQGVPNSTAPTTMSAPVSLKSAMNVSIIRMEQDQERAQGDAAAKLIAAASEVQLTGKGGQVDEMG